MQKEQRKKSAFGREKRTVLLAALGVLLGAVFIVGVFGGRPAEVTGFTGSSQSYDSVQLKWNPANGAQSYLVLRAKGKNGTFKEIGEVKGLTYEDTGLDTGVKYRYTIRSNNGTRKSWKSDEVALVPTLDQPRLETESTEKGVTLTAGEVEGATGYAFFRDGKSISVQKEPVFKDEQIKKGSAHKYHVVAYREDGGKTAPSKKSRTKMAKRIRAAAKLKGSQKVADMTMGDQVDIKGTIEANVPLKSVTVGVKDAKTNEWVEGFKYTDKKLDSKTFEMAQASEELSFEDLGEGDYIYDVSVKTDGGEELELVDTEFNVDFDPAVAAVQWALDMAADDTYVYGSIVDRGCALCGTSAKHKGQRHANTWTCAPFVGAAYAHGAGDPDLMAMCEERVFSRSPVALDGDNFDPRYFTVTGESCWDRVGSCRELTVDDLEVGDVIVSWNHHVCMYAGDGNVVHARGKGWGPDSICVQPKAAHWLSRAASKSGNSYVMRYNRDLTSKPAENEEQ